MTQKPQLSKAVVVDQALKIADTEGLEVLTIRRLALALGVTPMALYWHFRSKDDLMDAVADRIWAEVGVDVDRGAPWSDQLRRLMTSLLGVLRAHPSAPRLVMEKEKQSEPALRAAETALEVLRTAGFDPDRATEITRQGLWTCIMLVMSEPGFELAALPEAERAEHVRRTQIRLSLLPPAMYPRIVECAIPMTQCDDPELHYQLGIDIFIAGVETLARRREAGEDGPS